MGYALCLQPPTIAHCFKIVAIWILLQTYLMLVCSNLASGMHVAFTVASWQPWDELLDILEHGRGHLEVQAQIFIVFEWIQRFHIQSWHKKGVFVHACFQVSFSGTFCV